MQRAKYRTDLPQLKGDVFLTDGGLETTLIFHNGYELPYFAAFNLLTNKKGRKHLSQYFSTYAAIARNNGVGSVLESPTWRASADWGAKLGYSPADLADVNRDAIVLLDDIRNTYESGKTKIVVSGCMGPRGDGYHPIHRMSEQEAERYHKAQIVTFSETNADLVSALTMTYVEESIGLARAAKSADMPVVISFTVETDGKLPSGLTLGDAIKRVDRETDNTPAYYMINCAHPTHFDSVLLKGESWAQRLRGIRANASAKSHAELDAAEDLDSGNPAELSSQYNNIRLRFPHINILGGCCGTDHRHIEEIVKACAIQ